MCGNTRSSKAALAVCPWQLKLANSITNSIANSITNKELCSDQVRLMVSKFDGA